MEQIKWFKRKFDFTADQNIFPSILERLEGTPIRLKNKLENIPEHILTQRLDDNWSIQENVGHLGDLEPLWQGRLEDLLGGREYLREADLQNTKTHQAAHNDRDIQELLERFEKLRKQTLHNLRSLQDDQISLSALHPRLKKPMRIMDLFLFVAEHDDHHLARITEINSLLGRTPNK